MVVLHSCHKNNFSVNIANQMDWYTEICEQPVPTCTFKTEAPARCIRGQRPYSFPTVKLNGYKGIERPVVIVSCVDDKKPHRNHPFGLVGKRCQDGICRLRFNEKWEAQLENVGILATNDEESLMLSLKKRKDFRIDPFSQGIDDLETYDLQSFRLCFQVFIPEEGTGKNVALDPVVSEVIKAKSATNRLEINHLSETDNTSPLEGGKEVQMFCSNVDKNDVEVYFVHFNQLGQRVEMKGVVTHVHGSSGIVFQTPEFYDQFCLGRIKTYVYIYRPSNGERSPYWPFYYEASYPSMSLKMSSAKSRSSPYSRSRTKSGTAKISDMEKIIRDFKASLINDEGPRMSEIIMAAPIEALQAISEMKVSNNHTLQNEPINIDQYEEEKTEEIFPTQANSLDCGDATFEKLKLGPSLTIQIQNETMDSNQYEEELKTLETQIFPTVDTGVNVL